MVKADALKEIREALISIREANHRECSSKHGLAFIEQPGHELRCILARNVIRAQAGIDRLSELEAAEEPDLRERILAMMQARGWSTHWIHRSAYLHLEAAELAEAVRGKRGDTLGESGDVLITLLALSPHTLHEIVAAAARKVTKLETAPPYAGEERAAPPAPREPEPAIKTCPECGRTGVVGSLGCGRWMCLGCMNAFEPAPAPDVEGK